MSRAQPSLCFGSKTKRRTILDLITDGSMAAKALLTGTRMVMPWSVRWACLWNTRTRPVCCRYVRLMLFAGGSGASGILATARCAPECIADTDNITAANNAMAACLMLQESKIATSTG
jgi:hypothetical protein